MREKHPITVAYLRKSANTFLTGSQQTSFSGKQMRVSLIRCKSRLFKCSTSISRTDKGIANFHMVFLLGLLHHLGIFPNMESHRVGYYFDMLNGVFTDHIPMHRHYLNKVESAFFSRLLRISFENMSLYGFSRQERVRIIHRILVYYRLHLPDFPEIKSLSVMQSLFD